MKKIGFMLVALVAIMFMSCQTQFGLVYNVDLQAHGDGTCQVSYPANPEVSLKMLGHVDGIEFHIGDTVPFGQALAKKEVLEKGDKKERETMYKVNQELSRQFVVNHVDTAGGHYYVHVVGFVKEVGTGFVFGIDRTFTNEPQGLKAAVQKFEPYSFIK